MWIGHIAEVHSARLAEYLWQIERETAVYSGQEQQIYGAATEKWVGWESVPLDKTEENCNKPETMLYQCITVP